ncbi:MAG TPA: methyltransferase [Thermodesulfobacteriota bacterium]|nr:methyltransferase [Thermodesulfobacteriota bacterium]
MIDFLPASDETLDHFFDGTLPILQKKRGYRFSIDTILLSQFIRLRNNEKAIDLGTGCGILCLLLSKTTKAKSFVGIEIQKSLAELARKNVILNCLEDRISIFHQNFKKSKEIFPPGSFDVVFSNPPYRKNLTGRINPSQEKAIARHEIKGTLDELVQVAAHLLPTKGRCYLIYSASRAIDLLVALRDHNLEPKKLQFVHPRKAEDATLIQVESVKGGGMELKIVEPLFLDRFSLPHRG